MSMTWHKRYHLDALEGMRGLTLEQRGAYTTILDLLYLRGGTLPDDPMFISGWLGVFPKTWNRIRGCLIEAGKLISEGGQLTNRRATKEVQLLKARSVENKTNGRFGGLASKKINNLPEADARQTKTQNEKKKESESLVESEHPRPSPNLIVLDSAAQRRLRPSGGEEVQRGLSNFDGSVSFTDKELGALAMKCHLVKSEGMVRELMDSDYVLRNKPAHRKKLVINLVQKAHDKRAREVANVIGNIDAPLLSPDDLRERERRSEAAAEFQKRQDEKIRQRRATAQK